MKSEADLKVNAKVYANNDFRECEFTINCEQADYLRTARSRVVKVLELQDIYEQLIDAHLDSKTAMFKYAVENSISIKQELSYRAIRNTVNRHVFNTLNIGKLLLDKLCHTSQNASPITFVKRLYNDDSMHEEALRKREDVFKNNTDYVVGCALRNYAQHNSIVAKTIHTGFHRELETQKLTTFMSSSIQKKLLTKISSDLKERTPEEIELPSTMDGYVDGISEMYTNLVVLLNDPLLMDIRALDKFARDTVKKVGLEIINGFFSVELTFTNNAPGFNIYSGLLDMVLESKDKTIYPTRFKETSFNNQRKR